MRGASHFRREKQMNNKSNTLTTKSDRARVRAAHQRARSLGITITRG
jgi:hypothetical protein